MLTYGIMLDSSIVVHVQFLIMLIELKSVLSLNKSVCVARLPQPYRNEEYQNLWIRTLYFYGITNT